MKIVSCRRITPETGKIDDADRAKADAARSGDISRRIARLRPRLCGAVAIAEMDQWEDLDLLGLAHITFSGKNCGKLVFVALEADLDVRYGSRDGAACAEFTWEGSDDGSSASGRGWAALGTAGRLVGHIFIHKGDLGFVAERA